MVRRIFWRKEDNEVRKRERAREGMERASIDRDWKNFARNI